MAVSDADKAKKDYSYYRFNQLMKEQPNEVGVIQII